MSQSRFFLATGASAGAFFEQLGAEHDVAVFAAFSSADMNHHALAVDVAELQVC